MTTKRPVVRWTFREPDGSVHVESQPLADVLWQQRQEARQLALSLAELDAARVAADAFRDAVSAKARQAKAIEDASELAKLRKAWERNRPSCVSDAECDRITASTLTGIDAKALQRRRERAEKKERWTRC